MPATADPPRDEKTGKFVSQSPEKPADAAPNKPTEEGLATINSFAEAALGIPADKETDEEKAAKAKTKADAEKVAAEKGKKTPPTKPAAKAPAPKPAATPPPLTADQIAEAAARGVASAIKPKEPDVKPAPKDDLTPKQSRQVKILERMEQIHPEECKGFAARFKENAKKLLTYSEQWEKDHPGQEFDDSADEHAEFFEKNGLYEFWDQEDYVEALADMRADEKLTDHSKKTDGRLAEIDRRERLRDAAPAIASVQQDSVVAFATSLAEDVPGLVGEDGQVNKEKLAELRDDNPAAYERLNELHFEAGVLYRAMNGLQPWIEKEPVRLINGKPNPLHDEWAAQNALGTFAAEKERDLMARPPEEQVNKDGQTFLPAEKFWKLTEEQQQAHWTYTLNDLIALRAARLARIARQNIAFENQRFAAMAKKRGITVPDSLLGREKHKNGDDNGEADSVDEKPDSPSVGSVSRAAAKKNPGSPPTETPIESFVTRALA